MTRGRQTREGWARRGPHLAADGGWKDFRIGKSMLFWNGAAVWLGGYGMWAWLCSERVILHREESISFVAALTWEQGTAN